MHHLYTYGYTGGRLEDLQALAQAGAAIADIRLSPRSRVPQWNKIPLSGALGAAYHFIPTLGNRNYRGDLGEGIMLADVDAGLATLAELLAVRPVVLLCACKLPEFCHRSTVATAAMARWPGLAVWHLRSGAPVRFAVQQIAAGLENPHA